MSLGDSVTFVVEVQQVPNGKIITIRVQDLITGGWFNWDNGIWDANGPPKVAPNTTIYIAAAARNDGGTGTMYLSIFWAGGSLIAQNSVSVVAGGTIAIESSVHGTNPVITETRGIMIGVSP